jgi:alpha-L-fucosidase
LCDIASKGGNYLLNVGPTAQGEIPQPSLERLAQIGRWMDRNGEAIYGTTASPFRRYSFEGRATVKGNRLFVHVFDWPADGAGVKLVGLKTPVKSAKFLDGGAAATVGVTSDDRDGVHTLAIEPPARPDPYATVVALELDGPPEAESIAFALRPKTGGHFELLAGDADINGKARIEEDFIGHWRDTETTVSWQLNAPAAGDYEVTIVYSTDNKKSVGATYVVAVADSQLSGKVSPTAGTFRAFNTETLGKVKLKSGEQTLTIKPTDKPGESVMNLKEIRLTPVAP